MSKVCRITESQKAEGYSFSTHSVLYRLVFQIAREMKFRRDGKIVRLYAHFSSVMLISRFGIPRRLRNESPSEFSHANIPK